MGSSHTGKLDNYPPSKGKKDGGDQPGGAGGGGPKDLCRQDMTNVGLEEVGGSSYFSANHGVPPVGTVVSLRTTRVGPRLSIDAPGGVSVGFLPTQYNYLVVCMEKGIRYSGEVAQAAQTPIPVVRIDLRAVGQ